jgi:hypothetical protein
MFGKFLSNIFGPKKVVWTKADLERKTKIALEKIGRDYGIELDRRLAKDKLIKQLLKTLNK